MDWTTKKDPGHLGGLIFIIFSITDQIWVQYSSVAIAGMNCVCLCVSWEEGLSWTWWTKMGKQGSHGDEIARPGQRGHGIRRQKSTRQKLTRLADSWCVSFFWSHFCPALIFTKVRPSRCSPSSSSWVHLTPHSPRDERLLCVKGLMEHWQWTLHSSPFLYHLYRHSWKCSWEEREGHFLENCVGNLLMCLSLTSITEAGQKCLVSSYTHLFDKGPLWFVYQAPLHGYRIQGLWSQLWKFHCFLWLQQIAPKCYKCGAGKKKD